MTSLSLALSIWLAVIICQIALCFIVHKTDAAATYRWFARFAYFQTFAGVASFATYLLCRGVPYFVAYYTLSLFGTVMAFAVALEIHGKVFGPISFRPRWVTDRLLLMFGSSLAAAITLGVLLAATNGGKWTRALVEAEQVSTAALWASFVILWMYSRALKMTWRRHALGIERGFILYLSIACSTVFVRARWPMEYASVAGQIELLAYLAAVLMWCGSLSRHERAEEKATWRMAHTIWKDFEETHAETAAVFSARN